MSHAPAEKAKAVSHFTKLVKMRLAIVIWNPNGVTIDKEGINKRYICCPVKRPNRLLQFF